MRSPCFYEYRYMMFSASSNFIEPTYKSHRISPFTMIILIYNRFETITLILTLRRNASLLL